MQWKLRARKKQRTNTNTHKVHWHITNAPMNMELKVNWSFSQKICTVSLNNSWKLRVVVLHLRTVCRSLETVGTSWKIEWHCGFEIAITLEPAGKASFVYSCMQTRLIAQYNGKWPVSHVCVSTLLMSATTAIATRSSTRSMQDARCNICYKRVRRERICKGRGFIMERVLHVKRVTL